MSDIRKILCWIFACTSLMYLLLPQLSIVFAIARQDALLTLPNLLSAIVPIVCAVAWWTIWTGKSSARGWGIAASLTEITIFLWPILFRVRTAWPHHLGALVIGVIGMVVFSRCSSAPLPNE